MRKQYLIKRDQQLWLIRNYQRLGGRACADYLHTPIKIVNKFAASRHLRINPVIRSQNCSRRNRIIWQQKRADRIVAAGNLRITNKQQTYVLGFLWGDGYLHHTNGSSTYYPIIEIVQPDLVAIKPALKVLGNWHISHRPASYKVGVRRKRQGTATLYDPVIGQFLVDNDYRDKSHTTPSKILARIPAKIHNYFWRGYIDADGCFYRHGIQCLRQFSLAGSYNQDWTAFIMLLKALGITRYKVSRRIVGKHKTRGSIVVIANKADIYRLGKYLYGDRYDSLGLKRKYLKYLSTQT